MHLLYEMLLKSPLMEGWKIAENLQRQNDLQRLLLNIIPICFESQVIKRLYSGPMHKYTIY